MIRFHKIRYTNFLSTGNYFNEIQFDKYPKVLIAGKNGSGKSTLMDAICYVLFNKAFRRVNKPQLINSVTNHDCLVEIEFTVGRTEYLVRRGQKPNVFEIYRNGSMIEQSASSRDYQDILEKSILKMNYKTFCQIVILGNANYKPFMELPAFDRRKIVESLLDIELFSSMNTLLKERAVQNRNKLQDLEHETKILEKTIELNEKHKKQVRQSNDKTISKKKKQIEVNTRKIDTLNKKNYKLSEKIVLLSSKVEKMKELDIKLRKIQRTEELIDDKIESLNEDLKYYENTDTCSVCKQDIDDKFKAEIEAELLERKEDLRLKRAALLEQKEKMLERHKKYEEYFEIFKQTNSEMQKHTNDVTINLQYNKTLKEEIEELENIDLKINNSIEEKSRLRDIKKEQQQLMHDRELYNVALVLLKDSGIKTQIIKQYIPVINKLVNANLEQLEFFCKFEFNENFEESIKSRHRDVFSYASFSQGEKMRIDLSLLFAWREISRMRNASSVNLLVLDEIMDSSLDENGTEEFLEIVSKFAQENNIFIISHKHHQISDKFDDTIHFEKRKNFSRIT